MVATPVPRKAEQRLRLYVQIQNMCASLAMLPSCTPVWMSPQHLSLLSVRSCQQKVFSPQRQTQSAIQGHVDPVPKCTAGHPRTQLAGCWGKHQLHGSASTSSHSPNPWKAMTAIYIRVLSKKIQRNFNTNWWFIIYQRLPSPFKMGINDCEIPHEIHSWVCATSQGSGHGEPNVDDVVHQGLSHRWFHCASTWGDHLGKQKKCLGWMEGIVHSWWYVVEFGWIWFGNLKVKLTYKNGWDRGSQRKNSLSLVSPTSSCMLSQFQG